MRLAASGGPVALWGRSRLISSFGCDVAVGAVFSGALYLPHPVGIVIGSGVRIAGPVSLYQGVTLGTDKSGGYPKLLGNNKIFPNSVIVGGVDIGTGASVGAGVFVDFEVGAHEVVRSSRR